MDLALEYAACSSADPETLIRAMRNQTDRDPVLATQVARCASKNPLAPGGYGAIPLDIINAHRHLMEDVGETGHASWAEQQVLTTVSRGCAIGQVQGSCRRRGSLTQQRQLAALTAALVASPRCHISQGAGAKSAAWRGTRSHRQSQRPFPQGRDSRDRRRL